MDINEDEANDCTNLCNHCGGKPRMKQDYLAGYWFTCPVCKEFSTPAQIISMAVIQWNMKNRKEHS